MAQDKDELTIERSVDPKKLRWPPESHLSADDCFVRGYADMRGLSWDDVHETLILEKELVQQHSGDHGDAEESGGEEPEYYLHPYGLDVGVASAVSALSAANCAPFSSCSGAPGHHEAHPLVAFYCRKGRVKDILKAAESAGCGLCNDDAGESGV